MKWLLKFFDSIREHFEDGGKWSKSKPIFEAADNLFFSTPRTTALSPFGRDPMDVKRYMSMVIVALLPCFVASIYFYGWRVLAMVLVSYIAGGTVEVLFATIRKEEIAEGFLVTGFIFPLVLPPGIPLWMVAVGVVFGTLVGKEIFGGTGRNLFNPAIVGRVFVALSYPAEMAKTWMEPVAAWPGRLLAPFSLGVPDAVTSATPLTLAKDGQMADTMDLFIGSVAGSAGESSAAMAILGGVFLVIVGVSSWRTVLSCIGSFFLMALFLANVAPDQANPAIFNLVSGGFLFGAFFMATDPVSSPVSQTGRWVYGAIIGVTCVLIRTFSGYAEGMMFSILFANICAPLIDAVIIRLRVRRYANEK